MAKLLQDESGVALGLALIVVVILGVVGAGVVLTVRGDLEAGIQTDMSRRALYAADSGISAARRELLGDFSPASYDDDGGSNAACDSPADEAEPYSSDWSLETGGRTFTFDDSSTSVTVSWLGEGCGKPPGTSSGNFFRVVSEGTYGDARRKVVAVLATRDVDAPLTIYAAEDVKLDGANISGVSVFSDADVLLSGENMLTGEDGMYGDWSDGGSLAARPDAAASVGATGLVSGSTGSFPVFDSSTTPAFDADPGSAGLGFPFDPDYWKEGSRLSFLEEIAEAQGNVVTEGETGWPEVSRPGTVVLARTGGELTISGASCDATSPCRGMLVADGTDVRLAAGAVFQGCIVTSGERSGRPSGIEIEDRALLRGFASSAGNIEISGDVRPPEGIPGCTGQYGVSVWSWREVYE